MTNSQKNKLLTAAVVLLLYLPAFIGVAWTYAYFAPRLFRAAGIFEVRWGLLNGTEFQQEIKDTAWNERRYQVKFESIESFDSSELAPHLGPGKAAVTRFRISALTDTPEDAPNVVATVMEILKDRFNDEYFRHHGAPDGRYNTKLAPINLWEKPQMPFVPARPDVLQTVLVGTVVGMVFAAIGLVLIWWVLRAEVSERAKA